MKNLWAQLVGGVMFFVSVFILAGVAAFTWEIMEAGWDLGSSILN